MNESEYLMKNYGDRGGCYLVSLAAVFSIVTQRSSPQTLWGGALRDDTKNGCEGD